MSRWSQSAPEFPALSAPSPKRAWLEARSDGAIIISLVLDFILVSFVILVCFYNETDHLFRLLMSLFAPCSPPGTVVNDPGQQSFFKPYVVTSFFALDPFVSKNLFTFRQECLVKISLLKIRFITHKAQVLKFPETAISYCSSRRDFVEINVSASSQCRNEWSSGYPSCSQIRYARTSVLSVSSSIGSMPVFK
jgi:hypothetical protein